MLFKWFGGSTEGWKLVAKGTNPKVGTFRPTSDLKWRGKGG